MAITEPLPMPPGVTVRRLTPGDVEAGVALSSEAGWNQTAQDWALMIGRGPGWACLDPQGAVIATALTLPEGRNFAWVSMVLVAEAWRRRGIAKALMRRAIDTTRGSDRILGLDATPAGRTIYGPLGFQEIYHLTRFKTTSAIVTEAPPGPPVRRLDAGDLPGLAAMDLSALGADRGWLLAALSARAPGLAWIAEAGNGFCLGRDGRSAWQIGPVVAEDEVTAIALIRAALAQKAMGEGSGPMTLDVPDHHTGLVDWLAKAGFQAERPYTRMLLDHDRPLDDPGRVFAITGPELG